ncbi:hypothetical protein Hdeb2414_s0004g00148391 [Helianthus debilis subsp. tardiflorus]
MGLMEMLQIVGDFEEEETLARVCGSQERLLLEHWLLTQGGSSPAAFVAPFSDEPIGSYAKAWVGTIEKEPTIWSLVQLRLLHACVKYSL